MPFKCAGIILQTFNQYFERVLRGRSDLCGVLCSNVDKNVR